LPDSGLGFKIFKFRNSLRQTLYELSFATVRVHEADVERVERVFGALKPVTRPNLLVGKDVCGTLEAVFAREIKRWRRVFPEVGEKEARVFVDWIAANPHVGSAAVELCRTERALAGAIIFPAVIHAPDVFALDPARVQGGQSMGAMPADEICAPGGTAVKGKVLRE
jgi:hypothetical protein